MEAKELRIGNYAQQFLGINDDGAEYKEIIIEANDIYRISGWENNDIEPIPLTEEWLLKLGLKEVNNGLSIKCLNYYLDFDNETGLFLMESPENLEKAIMDLSHIKYVHQLQNLYFALTGEELTISKKIDETENHFKDAMDYRNLKE